MEHISEVLGPIGVLTVIAYIIKMYLDHRTRNKLIEKGIVDENIKHLFQYKGENFLSSLKWGMVLVGVGIAFLLGQFFPDLSEGIAISSALILAGAALLIFYSMQGRIGRGN